MDGSARISFLWGTEERTFRLHLISLRKVQDKTGLGPEALRNRIVSGEWRVDDLREPILQGLIGGGMKAEEAAKLVKEFVDDRPLLDSKLPALMILGAALLGDPDEIAKKAQAAGEVGQPLTASASAPSSEVRSV